MERQIKMTIAMVASLLIVCTHARSQTYEEFVRQENQKFRDYKTKNENDFKAFRDKANAEFADFMRNEWTKFQPLPAVPQPERPEPPKPVVVEPDVKPTNDPIPFDKVVTPVEPEVVTPPKPIIPIPIPKPVLPPEPDKPIAPEPVKLSFSFLYYGTNCSVEIDDSHRFKLASTGEKDVAKVWSTLATEKYDGLVTSCLTERDRLKLSDWGYASFIETMAETYFGAEQMNEARVMQMFILTQSGYKTRIARTNSDLVILLPFKAQIYEFSYIPIDGMSYYVTDTTKSGPYYIFNHEFPNEQILSLRVDSEPLFSNKPTESRKLLSKRYGNAIAEVSTNQNLIDFYNDFPTNSEWNLYSSASLSKQAKEMLYPPLRKSIEGKTDTEAANILINFVQTAFEYKTDDEQFGKERPLFADESLYYPYSDCEDRAIMFSILIRDLLGLDVILLLYPGHLATAVDFGNTAQGDYISLDDRKYLICDPTYIGASIGMTMPNYKTKKATIIKI